MSKLDFIVNKWDKQHQVWVKYLKKGKIFARYAYFSTYTNGVLTLSVESKRKNGITMISKLPILDAEIMFIGDVNTGDIIYADPKYIEKK